MECDHTEAPMIDSIANPKHTFALVVGIEKYDLGSGADLNGPARDARSFADWLSVRGVPRENIVLLLSPLDANRMLFDEWPGPGKGPATREEVDHAIYRTLRRWEKGQLLFFFWGGHGIMTADRNRRLFYADTSTADWHHLVLGSLLVHLGSDNLSGFQQQICFIDTCANYQRQLSLERLGNGETFPPGEPARSPREQSVFFATREGEVAKNLSREQTGLFSKVLLEELAKEPSTSWPPDLERIAKRVKQDFDTLIKTGAANQTPISVRYRAWDGTEYPLVQVEKGATERPTETMESRHRRRLIDVVQDYWITGFLEQSLRGAPLIVPKLLKQSGTVANPWRRVVQESELPDYPLPPGTRITQVYDDAKRELLILGEPGAGKTTLLLELARELLDRAKRNVTDPIPVVFNLSSWDINQSIKDWLVQELATRYRVPRKIGQMWVDSDAIVPLLDGLDEVAPERRAACTDAINTYRQEHVLAPTVVCSRGDYLELPTRLLLSYSVVVQPLTPQQIDDYLASAGEQLTAVRVALREDPVLQELATTPLMLSVLVQAYRGKPIEGLREGCSLMTRRRQMFEKYVESMLQRRKLETRKSGRQGDKIGVQQKNDVMPRYTLEQTTRWLVWLARQLKEHHQTAFRIQLIQINWLFDSKSRRLHQGIVKLVDGLISGLCCVLFLTSGLELVGKSRWFIAGLGWMLMLNVVRGVNIVRALRYRESTEIERGSTERHILRLGNRPGISVYPLLRGLVVGLIYGLILGLYSGAVFGISMGLLTMIFWLRRDKMPDDIDMNTYPDYWDPNFFLRSKRPTWVNALLFWGLVVGLLAVLLIGLLKGWGGWQLLGLAVIYHISCVGLSYNLPRGSAL